MPLTTNFPLIPQTVWAVSDPAVQRGPGYFEDAAWRVDAGVQGLITQGPRFQLGSGLYGIEYQLASRGSLSLLDADEQIAIAQIIAHDDLAIITETRITYSMIAQPFGGMYGGARLTLIVDRPYQDVELRLYSLGQVDFSVLGFKLIPRPGRVWFPADVPHSPKAWQHNPDRSATCTEPTALGGPSISLNAGEYRVGIKLMPPSGMHTGEIAIISVTAGEQIIVAETIVSAEQTLAHFAIPDAKLRFRLTDYVHEVDLRLRTLVKGVTLQWIRLATDDEATWHHYYNMGGRTSLLGLPISAFHAVAPSPYGLGGSVRRFEQGAIYWTVEHGPCEVYGSLYTQYAAQGETRGALGFPVSRPKRDSSGTLVQMYEGGTLSGST